MSEKMELKKGEEIRINPTNSLVQGIPISGLAKFDSWEIPNKTCYIVPDGYPLGKRLLINSRAINPKTQTK